MPSQTAYIKIFFYGVYRIINFWVMVIGQHPHPYIRFIDQEATLNKLTEACAN